MDSGSVGADVNRDLSEDLAKKSDVCIVYTRKKNRRKARSNSNSEAQAVAEPSVVSLGSPNAELGGSISPAGNCNLAEDGSLQLVSETIPAGQNGNFVEKGAVVDSDDTEKLAKEGTGGEEALPNGVVELDPPGEVEHRERRFSGPTGGKGCFLSKESRGGGVALTNGGTEPQPPGELEFREEGRLSKNTGGKGCFLSKESRGGGVALTNGGAEPQPPGELEFIEEGRLSKTTGREERLLDGGTELLSNHGKELDSCNRNDTNDDGQRGAIQSEELQVDFSASQVESLNNSKELQCNGGPDGRGDGLNDTSNLKTLPNGTEEPQTSVGQVNGGAELLASGHERHSNGVSSVVSRNSVLKPMYSVVEDRVRITISESSPKDELRGIKRRIENELNQVRTVMKKLEDKTLKVTAFNTSISTNRPTYTSSNVGNVGFYNQPHLMRVNSMVGGGGHPETRPFRNLSVSVMENNHGVGEFFEKEKRTPKANKFYLNSEFLLGKDRLPPESNKKHKPNGAGGKHGVGFGFNVDKNREKVFKNCSNLLQRLMKHKHGWVFNSPVDAEKLGLHDYHDIIKHPMDFGTIKTRLSENWYRSARQFAEDVRLVFRNAMTYNPEGQDVHIMAQELSAIFEDKWASFERESFPYPMYYDSGLPTPTPRKSYSLTPTILAPLSIPTPRSAPPMRTFDRSKSISMPITRPTIMDFPQPVRTPVLKKPKAKDPNKRDMTYEEKQKLSTNLQSLPSEKLDAVVQIINKRNSGLSQHNDEIEVDIDSVDAESLWELDRFVTNYKKNLSKHKRKAELAEQARATAGAQGVLQTNLAPTALDNAQRESEPGGNINPAPVQAAIPGDNASPSSSSSSSSSDSGSSSSDSDSDSSSASEDAGHSPKT